MAHRENVDLEPYLSTCVTFCLKCPTDEISIDGRQVTCLPNDKNPLVGNVSNSSYGGSKIAEIRRFQQSRKLSVQTGPIMARKIVFEGPVPKRLLMVETHFGLVKKTSPVKF